MIITMIFVEIGAHYGQSCEIARNPKYSFKEFWLFEPASEPLLKLNAINDSRYRIFPFGLGSEDKETLLYQSGSKGASILHEKFSSDMEIPNVKIHIRKSSTILSPILLKYPVFLKINCEGSEIEILNDLLDYGLLNSSHSILVDFDICRIKPDFSLDSIIDRLIKSGVKFYDADFFGAKSNSLNVKRWLNYEIDTGIHKFNFKQYFSFKFKLHLPLRRRIWVISSLFLTTKFKIFLYKRIKRFQVKIN
jgi:FkbM family methyltransferase